MSDGKHYGTPPSTYNEPAPGYNCAQCVTVASSYSNDPIKTQCSESCKNVKPIIQDCIMSAVRQNQYVQAQSISCVNQQTSSKIPVQECKTLCVGTYSNCINGSEKESKCLSDLNTCQFKCK
jgi:hypothetical protein